MKKFKFILGTLLTAALFFTSCSDDDNNNEEPIVRPTAEEFSDIRGSALEAITQTFEFKAEESYVTFTSEKGVEITIFPGCLTLEGNAITGTVELEYVEVFEKGNMITTNKPTMGLLPNGNKALLLTGGEFYINATLDGKQLETTCSFQLNIPADLTGGANTGMTLWEGIIDENGNLAWDEIDDKGTAGNEEGRDGVFVEGESYYAFRGEFGWTNVDIFYSDPREKTTLLAAVPEGYNSTNCAIYLAYNDQTNALALLDTYDPDTKLFSEHYGQIPIGLECHAIFVSEENGNWKYAVKAVTIVENGTITFTEAEMAVVTEAQLIAIINDLP
ncbi:MAG: hypothetical protein ACK5NB_06930 [Flavobacteriaceae bacterium]